VNSGLGLAIALEVARRGFRSVGSVRSAAKAAIVAEAARAAGVTVQTVELDVTDAPAVADAVAAIRPWAVVNNAGFPVTGAVEDVDEDEARRALETMVIAPMRLARLALPGMRAHGEGRIVNISSIYGRTTTPLTGWYQAAKHALEAVSDALRAEVASEGIHVVLIEPGAYKTDLWQDAERSLAGREGSRYATPYRRSLEGMRWVEWLNGDPSAVAKVVATALEARSPAARYLVGLDAQAIAVYEQVVPTALKDWLSRLVLGL
jgi:NAD(P)-dependent dehydrogenase (short-subunit alcohol dehydrogenase family)